MTNRAGIHGILAVLAAAAVLAPLQAADVEGVVTVMRRLTKPKVTAVAGAYARGQAVELHSEPVQDILALERSRVVVYLEGSFPPPPPLTATMEQKDRQFLPEVLVLPAGSTVSFPNLDPIFHNVFSLSKTKEFDLGNYPKDHTRTVTFSKPGVVYVNCHLHPNMSAAIVITPNGWSTKADSTGHFALSGVPPGDYTIVAWHKAAGFIHNRITVSADHTTTVNFIVPLGESATVVAQR